MGVPSCPAERPDQVMVGPGQKNPRPAPAPPGEKGERGAGEAIKVTNMSGRPDLVGRRFLSVTGSSTPRLSKLYEWDWRAGWIRSSTSKDPKSKDLQLLLEFDEQSWKERDWYDIYRGGGKESSKESEKEKK